MFRATLKSLLSRKVRLLLSGLAVILGVMFVSGAFVLTDTLGRSFDNLFATAYSNIDVNVRGTLTATADETGAEVRSNVPGALVGQLKQDPRVADAVGQVFVPDVGIVDPNTNKVLSGFGQQHFGANWVGDTDLVRLRTGTAPQGDNQVVVNAGLSASQNLAVGVTGRDQIRLVIQGRAQTFTVVGVFGYSGGRDSLAGETTVAFDTPVAQRRLLGAPGDFSSVNVPAAPGVSRTGLRDHLRITLGSRYDVRTGDELSREQSGQIKDQLKFVNYIFLGFAGVALFVGVFLILNTFSILVAQRTRELALMRAIGASRRQMVGSVLVEAAVIGLIASIVGLGAGIGIGALLAYLVGNLGSKLPLAGVGVPPSAVISAFAVGLGITIVAALLPALRASRVPPVAAMQDAARPDRPLTRLSILGGVVLAVGAALLALGLTGRAHAATLSTIITGVAVSFIGVTLLTPLIAKPVVSAIGALLAWRVPGELGRRNSARNPRRTAITAGALMVSVALVTAISTVYMSAAQSITSKVETGLRAEIVVAGQQRAATPPTFDVSALDRMRAVTGVADVVGIWQDVGKAGGNRAFLSATDSLPTLVDMTRTDTTAGSLGTLSPGTLVVDDRTAKAQHLSVGSTVPVQTPRGGLVDYRVAGVYAASSLMSGYVLPSSAATGFRTANPVRAFVKTAPGAEVSQVENQVNQVLADNPEVSAQDRSSFVKQQTSMVNTLLVMIQVLLLLAILIAVLGVVNTLVLSVIERTREIGMLRAIGLRRGQTAAMITVESVVISIFGALLGVVVGAGLGAAIVRALHDKGIDSLVMPTRLMITYLVAAALVGVLAAIIPAARAARLNVLAAIAYE